MKSRPPLLLGALAVVVASVALLELDSETAAGKKLPAPPKLDVHAHGCSAGPDVAGDRAREAEESAFGKIARYPFDPSEGVTAARLLDEAVQCIERSSTKDGGARVRELRARFVARLENDYRARRLRLDIALSRGNIDVAASEVRRIRRLLDGANDSYTAWLEQIERGLGESKGGR